MALMRKVMFDVPESGMCSRCLDKVTSLTSLEYLLQILYIYIYMRILRKRSTRRLKAGMMEAKDGLRDGY